MKRYDDYKEDPFRMLLTDEEMDRVEWTKYKIIVPTDQDKQDIMSAMRHCHDAGVDTEFISVNQLIHEYLNGDNIVVDQTLYDSLNK
jgi:hypothetical protein